MKVNVFLVLITGFVGFALWGCSKKDDPEIPNQEEIITTVRYTLTPEAGGQSLVFEFRDKDGDGGNSPEIVIPTLSSNTKYRGKIEILNEIENTDVTEEIMEEADVHQFFYTSSLNTIKIKYEDADDNNYPIGLATSLTTKNPGSGKLKITLRHQPNKKANGVTEGNITNAGGETDIEVEFDLNVQ